MDTSSALLHPVRLRLVQMLLGEGDLTTRQLHDRLPDVPIATLYRHVSHLANHGLIEVADEQQIRGASERTYRLAAGFANPSADELKALSTEELLTAFTVFTSGLIHDFRDYLRAGEPDLHADRVSFAQASFWASDDELDEFSRVLMAALQGLVDNGPGQGRRRRTLTTVLMPREQAEAGAAE
ncbi:helix-turn-helix domain-containing protein [Mobilicoccus massiliensis]|uniref:helix-turn-helix domain-containing protein n=1 Tax=Mobilicoccus massiliensis TaxID=1522310 RepID=UPI00059125C9|nr:helix-turn-helix domain-containing protein [Mobilicoccus massiliensis]